MNRLKSLCCSFLTVAFFCHPSFAQAADAVPNDEKETTVEAAAPGKKTKTNQIIVKLKAKTRDSAGIDRRQGTKTRRIISRRLNLRLLEIPKGRDLKKTLKALNEDPDIEYAEPDSVVTIDVEPNDPKFSDGTSWGLKNVGQTIKGVTGLPDADIDAPEGWDIRYLATDVKVAIVDTGILLQHEDLKDNLWTNAGEVPDNGIDDDGNGFIDDIHGVNTIIDRSLSQAERCNDDNSHGTHVAGILGAIGMNNLGISGVAWSVQLMAVKAFDQNGSAFGSDTIEGIEYARAMGANVINCSWGGSSYRRALYDVLKACRDDGIIVVVAAGNDGADNDSESEYPPNYLLDNIVVVASSNNLDEKSSFSNYGQKMVHLFAPGESVFSALSFSVFGAGYYGTKSGTSMAAPYVTGAIALMKAQFPQEPYQMIINRMLNSVDQKSSFDACLSRGRLNLYGALVSTNVRPFNDDFAKATDAGTSNGMELRSQNVGATREGGEGMHAGVFGTHSVWFTWKAASDGAAYVSTKNSSFDTLVGVYSGTTQGSLVGVASNDDAAPGVTTSKATFSAKKNTIYQIAVDGKGDEWGFVDLEFGIPPGNDNFATRIALSGTFVSAKGYTNVATVEAGEPAHAGAGPYHSIWYSWTAPVTGTYLINSIGSSFDTVLSLYHGTELNGLTPLIEGDDIVAGGTRSTQIGITAQAGEFFQIAIDGFGNAFGTTKLTISGGALWAPVNVGLTGSPVLPYDESSGVYTLTHKSVNTFSDTADRFFIAFQTLAGDGEIIARVLNLNSTNVAQETGLIIRENLDDTCNQVAVSMGRTSSSFNYRLVSRNNGEVMITTAGTAALPGWLKLVRRGNEITGYSSVDGTTWNPVGSPVIASFGNTAIVGMVAAGAKDGTVTMDHAMVNSSSGPTPTPPQLVSAVSRKTHGSAGNFDVPISVSGSGAAPVESRSGGSFLLVATFDKAVTSGSAAVGSGSGTVGSVSFIGNTMVIPLTTVANAQTLKIDLSNVTAADGGVLDSGVARLRLLTGDVNGSGGVTSADSLQVQQYLGQGTSSANFRRDVNASGGVTSADSLAVQKALGTSAP